MGRQLHGIEQGIQLLGENSDTGVAFLFGAPLPGSGSSFDDDAAVGSFYLRTTGLSYQKKTAGAGTDKWVRMANGDDLLDLAWRSELVRAATGQALIAGLTDPTGWSDNEKGLAHTDFAIGEYVIGGVGGTPALWEVTGISAPNITLTAAVDPLADKDSFVVRNYLPDSGATQENQALVTYNGTDIIKLADVDWDFATGINLSSGFTKANGTITAADTVESAIEKLAANQEDLTTLTGVAQGATDLGTFTGVTIPDNVTIKAAFQAIETALEAVSGGQRFQSIGVTAAVTLDEVLVDDVLACEWEIHMREDANPTRVKVQKLLAIHNGEPSSDATSVDDTVFAKLRLGPNYDTVVTVDLNGIGVAQTMRLRVSSSTAGVTYTARRTDITAP